MARCQTATESQTPEAATPTTMHPTTTATAREVHSPPSPLSVRRLLFFAKFRADVRSSSSTSTSSIAAVGRSEVEKASSSSSSYVVFVNSSPFSAMMSFPSFSRSLADSQSRSLLSKLLLAASKVRLTERRWMRSRSLARVLIFPTDEAARTTDGGGRDMCESRSVGSEKHPREISRQN